MKTVRCAPLAESADVIRGVTFSKADSVAEPRDGHVPVLRAGNIQSRLILEDGLVFVPSTKVSEKQRLRRGDIVMCTSSGSPEIVGKTAYSYEDWEGSFGAFCAVVRPKEGRIHSRYLFHYLQSPRFRDWTRNSSGVGIKNIRKSELDLVEVPLLGIGEQRRIAEILDTADAIRRKLEQALDLADEFLKSVFLEMFGDPGTNPKGWPLGTIRDLVTEAKYGTSQKADSKNGQYPVLRMGNITYSGRLDLTDLKYVDLAEKDVPKHTVRKGDLLFNRTNSPDLVGKTTVFDVDEPFAFAGYLVRARANNRADPYFISYFLNSNFGKQTLRSMCKSIIGMANINAQEFQDIPIPIPDRETQAKFRSIVDAFGAKRALLQDSMLESIALFGSLSQRAFRGEL